MAGYEDAEAAILSTIKTIAERAEQLTGNTSTGPVVNYAIAVNQLAEARAWLRTPNNSHGGGIPSKPN